MGDSKGIVALALKRIPSAPQEASKDDADADGSGAAKASGEETAHGVEAASEAVIQAMEAKDKKALIRSMKALITLIRED